MPPGTRATRALGLHLSIWIRLAASLATGGQPSIIAPMAAADQTSAAVEGGGSAGRYLILGTAGHIDHGKTSLIKALTGTDTDRLPEEQRRGMTIELGFAGLELEDVQFGVVDVPGHERFVRTMVAGATGMDLALIVVAADDSVMPQTIEHVEILHLLGVRHAVVAVTKIDTVESDMVELVVEEVRELLEGTPLAESAIVPVSSHDRRRVGGRAGGPAGGGAGGGAGSSVGSVSAVGGSRLHRAGGAAP